MIALTVRTQMRSGETSLGTLPRVWCLSLRIANPLFTIPGRAKYKNVR